MVLGEFLTLELSQWVPRHDKSTRRLSAMSPRMTLLAKSNMAAVGHDENQAYFFRVYTRLIPRNRLIFMCGIYF